jgi:hypothetical protein
VRLEKDWLDTAELTHFWGVNRSKLGAWRKEGYLQGSSRGSGRAHTYSFAAIHSVHMRGLDPQQAHLATRLPSVEKMVRHTIASGRSAIMTTVQVRAEFEIEIGNLLRERRRGRLIGFLMPTGSEYYYPRIEIERYARVNGIGRRIYTAPRGVPENIVKRVLGISVDSLITMSRGTDSVLVRESNLLKGGGMRVTTESFFQYLETYLNRRPDGTLYLPPVAWCVLRLTRNDPLVSLTKVIRQSRRIHATVHAAIQQGELPCLWTPGGEARIPQHAVSDWIAKTS